MKKNLGPNQVWEFENIQMRIAMHEDAENYYNGNFTPLDEEVARLTGSRTDFSREEVTNFFHICIDDDSRYDFLLVKDGRVIGESVINEIDEGNNSANFRICLFHPDDTPKGLGTWAIKRTIDFAFNTIKLHRLELEVFSFNPRAIRAYEKAGFIKEGVRKEAIKTEEGYADAILMAIINKR